jgi:hypothetical protein
MVIINALAAKYNVQFDFSHLDGNGGGGRNPCATCGDG